MAQLAAFFESAFFASYPSGCTGNLGVCSSFLPLPKARARMARRRSVCLVEETIGNYLECVSAHGSAERAGTMSEGSLLVNSGRTDRGGRAERLFGEGRNVRLRKGRLDARTRSARSAHAQHVSIRREGHGSGDRR